MALWLPHWPVQRVTQARPELAGRAVVLHGASRRGESVVACSRAAHRAGVEPGMPLAEAAAILAKQTHDLESSGPLPLAERREQTGHVEPHNPAADRAALVALAQWCHRFSPCVGLEDAEAPETLLLDATNLAPLYGSEAALVEQAARALRRRGLEARIAVADTIAAALGLARYDAARASRAVPGPGVLPTRLAPALPLAALRLPPDLVETLAHLGLACVGDVLALPRAQLRSRFGPLLVERINQFTGATPEVILAVDPPEEFVVGEMFEHPLTRGDAIQLVVRRLLERLARLLATRRAGALAVACRFECEGAPGAEFQFGLFRPTACPRHMGEIAELQLERLRLAGPAEAIEMRVLRHAPLAERQAALFDDDRRALDGSRPLAALVDRLAGRLGRGAVVGVKLIRDAQPELAYREQPLVDGKRGVRRKRGRRSKPAEETPDCEQTWGPLERPLCLLARAAPIEMSWVVPEGPPVWFRHRGQRYDVARHWGPERIETGWWRRQRAVRDYYRVETSAGQRFWLFRRRDGRWFLQGAFG